VTDYTYPPGWHTTPVSQYTQNTAQQKADRLKGNVMVLWMDGHVAPMSGRRLFYGTGTTPTDAYFDPTVADKP
jgi:prepilin-type processing-associated H-X9-DG protein